MRWDSLSYSCASLCPALPTIGAAVLPKPSLRFGAEMVINSTLQAAWSRSVQLFKNGEFQKNTHEWKFLRIWFYLIGTGFIYVRLLLMKVAAPTPSRASVNPHGGHGGPLQALGPTATNGLQIWILHTKTQVLTKFQELNF